MDIEAEIDLDDVQICREGGGIYEDDVNDILKHK
jgi:hypothetical protein